MKRNHLVFITLLISLNVAVIGCISGRKNVSGDKTNSEDSLSLAQLMLSAYYIDGCKEKILGNYSKAEEIFLEVINQNAEHDPSYYQLAKIEEIRENLVEAISWSQKAIALQSNNKWYRLLYANLLVKNNQLEEATKQYRKIIAELPPEIGFYEKLAVTLELQLEFDKAVDCYDIIISKYGVSEEICLKKYLAATKANNPKNALNSIEQLVEKYPYETRYLSYLADYYLETDNAQKAFEIYQRIIEIEPQNAAVHIYLADYYNHLGEPEKVFDELKIAFANPNLDIDRKLGILLALYDNSDQQQMNENQTYELLDTLIAVHNQNPIAFAVYADFLYNDDNFIKSVPLFQKVLELDSSRYLVWKHLLIASYKIARFDLIKQYGDRALNLFPNQAELYYYAAIGNYYYENFSEAIKSLNTGLFFAGNNDTILHRIYLWFANTYWKEGNVKDAEAWFAKAMNSNIILPCAWIDYQMFIDRFELNNIYAEDFNKVSEYKNMPLYKIAEVWPVDKPSDNQLNMLQKLIDEYDNDFFISYYAGFVFLKGEKYQKTIEVWNKALQLSKGAKVLESELENLKTNIIK